MSTAESSHQHFSRMLEYIASLAATEAVLVSSLSTLAGAKEGFRQSHGVEIKGLFRTSRVGLVLAYTWISLALCKETALNDAEHDIFVSLKGVKNPKQRDMIRDLVSSFLPACRVKRLGQEWLSLDFAVVDADLNLLFACEAEMKPVRSDDLSTDRIESWRNDALNDLYKLIHIPCPHRLYIARVDEGGRKGLQELIREQFDKTLAKGRLIHETDKFWVILLIVDNGKSDRYLMGGINHRGRFEWFTPEKIAKWMPNYSGFEP